MTRLRSRTTKAPRRDLHLVHEKRLQALARLADKYADQHNRHIIGIFVRLQKLDSDIVKNAARVLGDRYTATCWLVEPQRSLRGISPLQAIAQGRRNDVLAILGQIEHGFLA